MNDPLYHRLRESHWRRKLIAGEEAELRAWLAAHPEMEADWATEAGLGEVLSCLPDAPVPTNFTARVLNAIERESEGSRRETSGWTWRWRRLLPKAAVAAVVAVVAAIGLISYERHEATQRAVLARNVATVADVAAVPNPDLMQDFEAVRRLGQTPPADEELLALLR
jgi:negative regulator of sigma E activity